MNNCWHCHGGMIHAPEAPGSDSRSWPCPWCDGKGNSSGGCRCGKSECPNRSDVGDLMREGLREIERAAYTGNSFAASAEFREKIARLARQALGENKEKSKI